MCQKTVQQRLRERFGYRCAYCGTREVDYGSLLEVEHFQPRSKGGSDEFDNLVYACTACNRTKANYWPRPADSLDRHLLHPLHDPLDQHLRLLDDGLLEGITARGRFHINWLQLNRPQLVQKRQERREYQMLLSTFNASLEMQRQMQATIDQLQDDLADLMTTIEQLQ